MLCIADNTFSVLISAACDLVTCFFLLNDASLIFDSLGPFKTCFGLQSEWLHITPLKLIHLLPEQKHKTIGIVAPHGGGV